MARQFDNQFEKESYQLLLQGVKATYAQREPERDQSDAAAEAQLQILSNLFDVDVNDVIHVFHKASMPDQVLSSSELVFLQKIAHPTFLDLNPDYQNWRGALYMNSAAHLDLQQQNLPVDSAMYLFNCLFESKKREVLQGLNLNDPKYRDDAVLLQELRNRLFSPNLANDGVVESIPLPQARVDIETKVSALRRADTRNWATRVMNSFRRLDRRALREVQELRQEQIDIAYQTAFYLRALMSTHQLEGRITPKDVMDNYTPTGLVKDPLVQTWALKITEDEHEEKPDRLLSYWDNSIAADAKPKNDRVIRAILAKVDKVDPTTKLLKLRAFTISQLASQLGHAEDELSGFMFATRPEQGAWEAKDGKWVVREKSVFESLWVFLGYDKPEDFLPAPDYAAPVKVAKAAADETTQRTTLPPPDPYADAKAIFGDAFKPEDLIKKALALGSSAKGQARITVDLQDALKNPSRYLRSDGLPSLPHLLLMHAHNGNAYKDMSIDAVSAALQTTFDPKGEVYKAKPRTGYRAFVWTLLQDAQANSKPIASYADLLAAYDFKQDYGVKQQDKVEVINPDRNSADGMANRILGYVNDLFARASVGEDLTSERDSQLIAKMVAVAGDIMNEKDPKNVAFVAFLGPIARPARRAAANIRQAFLTPKKG